MPFKVTQLLLAVLLVTAALSAEARLVVRMVQVAHRHGARGSLVVDNTTDICGLEYPCGELTGAGIAMLNSVGQFVRERYSDLSLVEKPLFPTTRYNSSVVYTRSTGIQRTIQSATAFLSGLFPDDYFYPVVYSHNYTTDTLLNTDIVPSVAGKRWLDMDKQNAALNPIIDSHLTKTQIEDAAKEAYIEGLCSDFEQRSNCAYNLYDIATSFDAAGRLKAKKKLAAIMPALVAYTIGWYRFIYDYDKSVEIDNTQGSAAQNLAQTMVANMNAHKLSPSFTLYEFSTHDVMVSPLAATIGDHNDVTMNPPYATSIIVELLQDTESPNDWYVRPLRGNPILQDTGSYKFVLNDMEVRCIDAAGNQYLAATGICPLDGFRRMMDYSRPSVPNGQCTMPQNQYDNMGCPRTVADGKPVPYYCWLYRYVCPQTACPDGNVLGREDLQCYPLGPTTTPAPQPNSSPVPMAWTPRTMDPKKAKDIAAGLLRGVEEGVVLGSATRKHGE
ncbi:putative histidine secretory acid phosphatase [Leptomonas pyrrhocoris]|uniref:Putative histidine secretory acid phosphatase n=1 Tax=Leptomonas pyrrhocoris TaxID=157538 RepID=A0A0M9G4A4_LEPPY|nr:putative histidine secretory acid phosphatase [Leptomonas pyrrhocoris]XP_015660278.1 putative histidine secretory acid phosphatase [Leptomonas pyrrhocoris]XP_015660279.1 putative histidine secretory acid phosphatase [Leptomonas pyrrhocoris]KPA81838.1 putative histidine secretory acid phosphatase [Leptomonas pyrrhocoris]KPA81839.1 putative histidine secretory acid phosphatase [Leptomonas pyrrhocoris]KPA81840.1 putative histidine secretory acid phosphatase [Leptomonas pyrrhocoris]|eukprot:XP_015660277.1 putative histidine secretory acid phosphatase [Leptomonas pyrrhocoris]